MATASLALLGTFHLVDDDVEASLRAAVGVLGTGWAPARPGLHLADRIPGRIDRQGRHGAWVYLTDAGALAVPLAVQLARAAQTPILLLRLDADVDEHRTPRMRVKWAEHVLTPEGKLGPARPSCAEAFVGDPTEGLPAEPHQALVALAQRCGTFWMRGEPGDGEAVEFAALRTTGEPRLDALLDLVRVAARIEKHEIVGGWALELTDGGRGKTEARLSHADFETLAAAAGALLP